MLEAGRFLDREPSANRSAAHRDAPQQPKARVMSDRLRDKVAIVFGAGFVGPGWGNGKATAALFSRHGARVVCVDVNRAAADETAEIILGEGGLASAHACDATDSGAVAELAANIVKSHSRIDILHNNVGFAAMGGRSSSTRPPGSAASISALRPATSPANTCCRTCRHGSRERSPASRRGPRSATPVTRTRPTTRKAAVNNFTMGLALQYARGGIRVNAVMPGLMNTPLIHQQISGQYADAADMIAARDAACPTGRMGTTWDVAHAALFLASDEAAHIIGVSLPVDGGLSCHVA
jgi:NAD(P)-dependent dehydrogenase (short-subunit alcohol dehydrogenase family)